jgi:hypothetical protein
MVLSFIDYRLQLKSRRVMKKSSTVLLSGSSHISAVAFPLNQEDGSQDLNTKIIIMPL